MSKESKVSKFKNLLDAVKTHEPEVETKQETQPTTELPTPEPEPEPKRGRPKGKRSHPDYEQVTAYIRKDTHNAIKIALLQEGEKREFSQLVQELLEEWVKSRT